jgi:nitroreductase
MDVFEAIQKRRSIRAYESTPVPREKLEKILEAARLAPSASNIQPWHFIVVTDSEKRKTLSRGRYAKFLKKSPVVIVGCGDQKASPKWYMVDVAIAMQNMVLTATSEGLGTCWVGSFDEDEVKRLLKIPENFRVVALLAVGYSLEKGDISRKILHFIRRRKRLERIVSFEEHGKKL